MLGFQTVTDIDKSYVDIKWCLNMTVIHTLL